MLKQNRKKTQKITMYIVIIVITIAVTLSVMLFSVFGTIYLCIWMPDDASWQPYSSIKAGTYTTQDDCTEIFGSNNVVIEIIKVNAADISGEMALALFSDSLMLTVNIDGEKSDVYVVGTYTEYQSDRVIVSFALNKDKLSPRICFETVGVANEIPKGTLAFYIRGSIYTRPKAVFRREGK